VTVYSVTVYNMVSKRPWVFYAVFTFREIIQYFHLKVVKYFAYLLMLRKHSIGYYWAAPETTEKRHSYKIFETFAGLVYRV